MAEIVKMPKLGFDMAEGTLVRWVVNEGDPVIKGAVLAEIETDKATVEVESTFEGVLLRQLVQQGTAVPINEPIAVIGEPGESIEAVSQVLPEKQPLAGNGLAKAAEQSIPIESVQELVSTTEPLYREKLLASPLARSMAADLGIDLRRVQGSGPGGRITKKDILAFQQKVSIIERPKLPGYAPIQPIPSSEYVSRGTRSIPLPRLRSAIGRRMTESKQQAPHFYVTHEYDVGALMDRRQEVNALLAEDSKLSVNDFMVRAVALTLLEFPNLNASLDFEKSSVIHHGEINIGVAVAVENGLLTVVNRNTEQKSVYQISTELRSMVKRARDGKVRPEDIEGSTFTISNLGMYDVDEFLAIINPPEAAILAVGSAKQVPVVVNHEIKIGTRLKATLSVDHRISDGVEGARFLQALARYIEEPLRLILAL
jgi:pyruvate dehydrogenase E2 component (dihydrolipoamide acetyltransferase)